jgi:Pyruvate/2-oxoacid:ferredoxin oxidoreductase delta subunit
VPVNIRLEARPSVLPYEDLRSMIDACSSFRVADCLCRKEKGLLGHPCTHPSETCMSFAKDENAYEGMPPWGRVITKEEALGVLDLAEREGLVHCTYNFQKDPFFVCNCCSCCCGFLRALTEHQAPFMLARANYVSVIDADTCSECGDCANGRCPTGAISAGDESYTVEDGRCIGCGVCAVACSYDAIRLVPRPEAERVTPPATLVDWSLARIDNRHGRLKGAAVRGRLAWEGLKIAAARRRTD